MQLVAGTAAGGWACGGGWGVAGSEGCGRACLGLQREGGERLLGGGLGLDEPREAGGPLLEREQPVVVRVQAWRG